MAWLWKSELIMLVSVACNKRPSATTYDMLFFLNNYSKTLVIILNPLVKFRVIQLFDGAKMHRLRVGQRQR